MAEQNRRDDTKPLSGWGAIGRFAAHYWRPYRLRLVCVAVLIVSSVAMDVIVPLYAGKMVDAATAALSDASSTQDHAAAAWRAFAAFVGFGFLMHVLRCLSSYVWNAGSIQVLSAILRDATAKVQRFGANWHANSFAGGTVRKITRGMWSFDTLGPTVLMGIFPTMVMLTGVTVMLTVKLQLVGFIAAVMIAVYVGVSIWLSLGLLRPRFVITAEQDSRIGATLADMITGNATVKDFAAETREDQRFAGVVAVWSATALSAWNALIATDIIRAVVRNIMTCAVVGYTLWLWQLGRATAGDIVLVMTTLFILDGYLRNIGTQIAHLQRAASEMDDVVSFWLREDDVGDVPDAQDLSMTPQARQMDDFIRFDNVDFAYPSTQRLIYQGMNVDIRYGEKLALVGASGSGKSTFVKLLQRLYNIDSGRIMIAGQDLAQVTLSSLRRHVALVPQDPILFHRSLAENIAYGRPEATQEEIEAAARKAFAHEFIEKLPLGYGTLVGERGVKLSGGERQRVAIARAILADSPVLILDEATSSLDSISEHYIQQALEYLMQGRTTITIAHRLSTVRKVDRILVFDGGRIVEQGSHTELMANPQSRYRALYEMQALDLFGENEDSYSVVPK